MINLKLSTAVFARICMHKLNTRLHQQAILFVLIYTAIGEKDENCSRTLQYSAHLAAISSTVTYLAKCNTRAARFKTGNT